MRSFKIFIATALTTAIGCAAVAQSTETAPLSVTVNGLRNANGAVIVAAFDQASAFEEMDVTKAVAMAYLPAAGAQISALIPQ